MMLCTIAGGEVICVDADAPGANDGSSWVDAYNCLQDGLAAATSGDEIWVAQGIYKPDQGDGITPGDRTAAFHLKNGVAIKGGYAGFGESDPNAHHVDKYETILSADLDGNDVDVNDPADLLDEPTRVENSYHVVTGSETDETAILDGFTIMGGNANGPWQAAQNQGAGMYNYSGSPTLTNCTFRGNLAASGLFGGLGGAISNDWYSSPTLTECMFIGNAARDDGGGMFNRSYSNPTLTKCTFTGNYSDDDGGGMFNWLSSPVLTNCTFISNSTRALGWGGAICNWDQCSPKVTNCIFRDNSAYVGGGMYNWRSNLTAIHCTFDENLGGGMYNGSGDANLTHCTFSENQGSGIYNGDSTVTLSYCAFNWNRGGGMYNNQSSATLTNSSFYHNNSVGGDGGGIYNSAFSNLTLTNCTLTANHGKWGGGMHDRGNTQLTNCIFSWNTADYDGGAIDTFGASGPTATNCTFRANSANRGGGIYLSGTNQILADCIFWDNTDSSGNGESAQIYVGSGTPLINYCCIQGLTGSLGGVGNIGNDPVFAIGPLGNYYLSQTAAGQANNSPCVDAGSDLAANLGMNKLTTRTDGVCDEGVVDMGYHYSGENPADFDSDGKVNLIDFAMFALAWLTNPRDAQWNPACDISIPADNLIDMLDLAVLVKYWLAGK